MSEPPQQQPRQSGRSKTLLVADDSKATQKVVALTFEDEGWRVLVASDAEEAWRQFETDTAAPDILLADVFMPGDGGGLGLCKRIKTDSRFRHIPVVLLVGTFEPFDKAEARRVGADDLLTKPFQSIRDLVGRIGSLFDGQSKEQAESVTDERSNATVAQSSLASSDTEYGKQTKSDEENLTTEANARGEARGEAEADKVKSDDATNATDADRFADQTFDDQLIEAVPAAHFGGVATENVTHVESDSFNSQHQHDAPQTLTLFEPTDELDKPESTNDTELSGESQTKSAQNEESSVTEISQSQVAQTTPLDPDAVFVRAEDNYSERTNDDTSPNQTLKIRTSPESQFLINAPNVINSMDGDDDNADDDDAAAAVLPERNQAAPIVASPATTDTQTNTMPHTSYSDHDTPARESFAEDALLDIDDSVAPITSHTANNADAADDFVLDLPDDKQAVEQNSERASLQSSNTLQTDATDDALDLLDVDGMNTAPDVSTAPPSEIPVSSIGVQSHHAHVATAESDIATVSTSAVSESHSRETDYQVSDAVTETTDSFAQVASSVQSASTADTTDVQTQVAGQISPEQIEQIARRTIEMMSERVVQEIAWEVVPQLAELLIKQRLDQDKS